MSGLQCGFGTDERKSHEASTSSRIFRQSHEHLSCIPGLPPRLPGYVVSAIEHGDDPVDLDSLDPSALFTLLSHEGSEIKGWSVCQITGSTLYTLYTRHWGEDKSFGRRGIRAAVEFAQARGCTNLVIKSYLPPAMLRRWLDLPLEHVADEYAKDLI